MRIDISALFPFEEKELICPVSYKGGRLKGHRVAEAPEFLLRITHLKDRMFQFSGEGSITLSFSCDRCLKEVPHKIPFSIDRKADITARTDEDGEAVFFFPDDQSVDADLLIEDEVLLNLPVRILCREDCKGLCPVCGADLNKGPCGCSRREPGGALQEALIKALKDSDLASGTTSV